MMMMIMKQRATQCLHLVQREKVFHVCARFSAAAARAANSSRQVGRIVFESANDLKQITNQTNSMSSV